MHATAAYLIGLQRVDELPPTLALDVVAAAYYRYLDEITTRLAAGRQNADPTEG